MIPQFYNTPFNELSNDQKIAMVERVCMEHCEYLADFSRSSSNYQFLKYWSSRVLKLEDPSNSSLLDRYVYVEKNSRGLCIVGPDGEYMSIKKNTEEVVVFVFNVVNEAPAISPIMEKILEGKTVQEIIDGGVDIKPGLLASRTLNRARRKGRPADPHSLSQRIKRGEITRYEAYQKKIASEEDDAL